MNRFLIEHHPDAIAKSLCDKHIVKMPLEEAQMLCTAVWHHAYENAWHWLDAEYNYNYEYQWSGA